MPMQETLVHLPIQMRQTRTECLLLLKAGCDWEGQMPIQDCWTSIDEKFGGGGRRDCFGNFKYTAPPETFRKNAVAQHTSNWTRNAKKGDIYCTVWRPKFATSQHTCKTKNLCCFVAKMCNIELPLPFPAEWTTRPDASSQTNMTFGMFFTLNMFP